MAQKWLPASSLTGGGEGALDAIDGSNVSDGDRAIVIADLVYFYVLDADSGLAESSPSVISPAGNAGNKRWVLVSAFPKIIDFDNGNITLGEAIGIVDSTTTNSAIIGGEGNVAGYGSENNVIAGGENNFVKLVRSTFASGKNHRIMTMNEVAGAHVSGIGATVLFGGQKSHANGFFNHPGDAQVSKIIMREETTDDSETSLFIDNMYGVPTKILLYGEKTWKYTIDVVARQVGGAVGTVGDSAMWRITGGLKNVGGTLAKGTVTISGTVSDGDTVTVCSNTYTFRDTPTLATDLQAGDAATAATSLARVAWAKEVYLSNAEISGTNVVFTISPEMGGGGNSQPLTCSGANISTDGGGTFGGTSEYAEGDFSGIGTIQGIGPPNENECDQPAGQAKGTVTISGGVPLADETLQIDDQTFIWKATRTGTGEVELSTEGWECLSNLISAINTDLSTVEATQMGADYAHVEAVEEGLGGMSIVFTSASTNVTMDGDGTLGGTTAVITAASTWDVNMEDGWWVNGIEVLVTGEADKTIHWVANIELVEVG
ncbi:hypothetical protein [Desulfotignum balticum]|uniref:hypothetical protein n=1 Tax=Desulfotignum balticum TaxID=115781 RepID=UPI0003FB06D4|nr:hypothetical protein [Desulfotignum balticum]